MFWVQNKYAKIFKVFKPEEKYVDISISTSEKDKDGEYVNSQWPGRVIGHAFNQIKKGEVKEGDTVAIYKAKLSNERYQVDGEWKSALRLLILEFGEAGTDPISSEANRPVPVKDTKADVAPVETKSGSELPW